jgi:hypothetical protein
MKIKNAIALFVSGSLLAPLSVQAQETARLTSYGNLTCNYVSYMVTPDGRCIDLSQLGVSDVEVIQNEKQSRFLSAFAKLKIPVKSKKCEEATTVAFYNFAQNVMYLCQGHKHEGSELIETLAHEGWHVVQDCVDGLQNSEIHPVSQDKPALFASMVDGLTVSDLSNLKLYDSEDLPYEVEAFTMEKHPEIVLKGLNACINSILAKT